MPSHAGMFVSTSVFLLSITADFAKAMDWNPMEVSSFVQIWCWTSSHPRGNFCGRC
jgi:hypothetical protein